MVWNGHCLRLLLIIVLKRHLKSSNGVDLPPLVGAGNNDMNDVSLKQKRKAKKTVLLLVVVVTLIYVGFFYMQASR
jgi:hypothetical protein